MTSRYGNRRLHPRGPERRDEGTENVEHEADRKGHREILPLEKHGERRARIDPVERRHITVVDHGYEI